LTYDRIPVYRITPTEVDQWFFAKLHPHAQNGGNDYLMRRGSIVHSVVGRSLDELRRSGRLDPPSAVAHYFDTDRRMTQGLDSAQRHEVRAYLLDALWNAKMFLDDRKVRLLFVERPLETKRIPVLR